jgi:hypothetical protein
MTCHILPEESSDDAGFTGRLVSSVPSWDGGVLRLERS